MRLALSGLADIVGFADPASGRLTTAGARSAIIILGQDGETGRAFQLDEWAKRCSTDELTDKIFEMQGKWRCQRFGVESSAQQSLYVDSLIREANIRKLRIAIVPINQPTNQTKEFRITSTLQRWIHPGLLFINKNCKETIKEVSRYPYTQDGVCDVADALASACIMLRDPYANRRKVRVDHLNFT